MLFPSLRFLRELSSQLLKLRPVHHLVLHQANHQLLQRPVAEPVENLPHGPHGHPSWGIYVDTLQKALLAAAACLILFLLFNYVLVAAARLHAAIARSLLRAGDDPLREAKEVLNRPGPLARRG